jgi:hypothetical protein
MRTPNFVPVVIGFLALALPAAAQLDSGSLRARYGQPENRETFHMPAGFDMVVDYGASYQVCMIEVPALMPSTEKVQNSDVMKRRMYDFLAEVVPASMRGTERQSFLRQSGITSVWSTEYDFVSVSELRPGVQPSTITIMFKRADCQKTAMQ